MSTEFYNRNWRMPKSSNSSKVSNYSMSFDGGSELIDIGNDINFEYNDSFSYSFWLNPSSVSGVKYLFSKYASSRGILIYLNSSSASGNNSLEFNLYNKAGGSPSTRKQINTNSSSMALPNEWTNIVITYDGSGLGSGIALYKNGVSQTVNVTQDTLDGNTILTSQDAYIGGNNFASTFFSGKLDHFAIFDYALSASQITSLYGNSTDGVGNPMSLSPKPIAYYPIGDYAAFNGSEYLVPNSAISDYVFDFDGSNDYIEVSSGNSFDFGTNDFAISSWVNTTGTTSQHRTIACKQNPSNAGNWSLQILTNGKPNFYANNGSIDLNSASTVNDGNWHNIILKRTSDVFELIVDNVIKDTQTVSSQNLTNTENLRIGHRVTAYNAFFNGSLSNISIFNTALPATGTESIESLYNYGTPPDISSYSGLQGFWKLDASATFDGSNWSIPDDSSNSNTGTSSGMTAANLVQSNLNITTPYSRYALDFDGTNDRVGLTSSIDLGTINSISVWVRNEVSQDRTLLGEASFGSNYHLLGGYSHFILRVGSKYNVLSTGLTPIIPIASNWSHLVFVRNGDDVSLYINGSLAVSSNTWAGGSPGTDSSKFDTIGSRAGGGVYWLGKISNVSAFNLELSAAQVTELYNQAKPSNLNNHSAYSNLISWWQLGENSSFNTNFTVLDEKGTNNGTSANMGEDAIVNGVATSGNGITNGMTDNIIGDAPYSTANAISYGMGVDAKSTDVPS